MEDTAMSTEPLRDLLEVIMARDLLSLDMATPQELAITTEVPREFRDMVMEVTTRELLSLVMVTPQELAITTEVPREFRDMVMGVTTRDLLSLVMVITMVMDTLMSTRTVTIIMDLMDMRLIMITRRDLLRLDTDMAMDMALLMFMLSRRTMAMVTQSLMNMDTTFIRDQLSLDMVPMKVTKKFPTLHTPIMISKCTTLTKQMEIVPHLFT